MVSIDAMAAVIADLSDRADNGDEEAARQLNQIADTCPADLLVSAKRYQSPPPLVRIHAEPEQTLGEILAQAMGWEPCGADEYDLICGASSLIGDHYGLDALAVMGTIFELEGETREAASALRLMECPLGLSTLGKRVAERLIGPKAHDLPSLRVSCH